MIQITLKISDKEKGTPGEVCELIQQAIEAIEGKDEGWRFEVEEAHAESVHLVQNPNKSISER